jgi:hypothetical protein
MSSRLDSPEWIKRKDSTTAMMRNLPVEKTSSNRFRGYGWPATLELLSPPIGKPVDSRQTAKMSICPACKSVHEDGGYYVSGHGDMASLIFDTPVIVVGNDNSGELNSTLCSS